MELAATKREADMSFSLSIQSLFRYHLFCIAVLALGYVATIAAFELFRLDHMMGVTRLLALDEEQNIPSLFSCLALFLVAAGSFGCARTVPREAAFWNIMGCAFAFLAVDEAVSIHELFAAPFLKFIDPAADYASAWAIPYAIGVMIFLGFVTRHLLRLPASVRNSLIIAGLVFLAGAIGFERLSAELMWTNRFHYSLVVLAEETLEMTGIALALRAILLHLNGRDDRITGSLRFG